MSVLTKSFILPNGVVPRFLLLATGMFLAWFLGYELWLKPAGQPDATLCNQIAVAAVACLQGIGFVAAVSPLHPALVVLEGQAAVIIGSPCNGLSLYALFAGFVGAFPGPGRHKVWFIPTGIILLWGLNVARVVVLALNHYYSQQSVDFNHHYTFTLIVYACIFGLWMFWVKRLAVPVLAPTIIP